MRVTIGEYYKSFASLYGILAALPFAPPLLHASLSDSSKLADDLFPPLGDFQHLAVAATVGTLLLATLLIFLCSPLKRTICRIVLTALTVGFLIGVAGLAALYVGYVRRIPVSSVNEEVLVSVGYQRTVLALRAYPGYSDSDMLEDSGPWESKIQILWTSRSIWVVRTLLWASYTLTLACFLSFVSLAAYRHATEEPPTNLEVGEPRKH
jgi:hypothetical protein